MKKSISVILAVVLCLSLCFSFASCKDTKSSETSNASNEGEVKTYSVGVCQLMKHDSLDQATAGFEAALKETIENAGHKVEIDTQVAGEATLCSTIINTFNAKNVDLIMGNATPALTAAASGAPNTPVLGTSVTDYESAFEGNIPANVSGTSDAVPFDEQAQMMIDTLSLTEGDVVGVLYCANESNSKIQYDAVKKIFEASNITVTAYTFSETTELQALTQKMAGECKAVFVPSDNTVANNDSIVGTICTENGVPVFTSYASNISYASLAIDYYELGYETGKMAAQILLEGKEPSELEVKTLVPTTSYNQELCAELNIAIPE